jgi:hypothetical protein
MIPINKIQNNHVEKLKPIGHETPSSRPSIIVPPQKKIPSSRPSKIDEVFRNRPTQTETHLIGLQKLFRLGCETRFSFYQVVRIADSVGKKNRWFGRFLGRDISFKAVSSRLRAGPTEYEMDDRTSMGAGNLPPLVAWKDDRTSMGAGNFSP